MRRILPLLAGMILMLECRAWGEALRLEEAVQRAGARAQREAGMRLAMAKAQERLLEEQSKFRVELRPRLALFTFSSPALLAASLGSGLLLGRNTPSPLAVSEARLNRLAAEIGTERFVVAAERNAKRTYFQLASLQQSCAVLADLLSEREQERERLLLRVRQGRATAAETAALESEVLSLQMQLEQAELERAQTALTLADATGLSVDAGIPLVEVMPVDETVLRAGYSEAVYRTAMQRSAVASGLARKVAMEKNRLLLDRRLGGASLLLAYSNIQDGAGKKLGLGSGGFLLGGHSGTLDFGFRVPLRKSKEPEAWAAIVAAKLLSLEFELEQMEQEARQELASLRLLAASSSRKAELAGRKLRLAEQAVPIAQQRERAGLEADQAVTAAASEVSRLRAAYRTARGEGMARVAHLMAVAGMDWKDKGSVAELAEGLGNESQ